jgi:hypothetical protein
MKCMKCEAEVQKLSKVVTTDCLADKTWVLETFKCNDCGNVITTERVENEMAEAK